MLKRIILYFISYLITVIGLVFIILYINLFSFGYNIFEYLKFIFTHYESLLFFLGIFLFVVLAKGDK